MTVEDDLTMPFGKHKGTKLKDLPRSYIFWLSEQDWIKEPLKTQIYNLSEHYARSWVNFSPHIVSDYAYEMCGCGLNGD